MNSSNIHFQLGMAMSSCRQAEINLVSFQYPEKQLGEVAIYQVSFCVLSVLGNVAVTT